MTSDLWVGTDDGALINADFIVSVWCSSGRLMISTQTVNGGAAYGERWEISANEHVVCKFEELGGEQPLSPGHLTSRFVTLLAQARVQQQRGVVTVHEGRLRFGSFQGSESAAST